MSDEKDDQASEELEADRVAAFRTAATYIDTWFLTTWRGHIRIALGEIPRAAGPDHYRFAIVLEEEDARRLIQDVKEMLDRRIKRSGSKGDGS